MNDRETAEVRRSLGAEKNAVTRIVGAYVNASGGIITTFDRGTGLMADEEFEKYLAIFRKTVSGTAEKNLLPIEFSASQVGSGEEHALLTRLRKSELNDAEALETFYGKITSAVKSEENYVILLTVNHYDVPFKAKDGGGLEDAGEMYSYLVCAICPVKATKAQLTYDPEQKTFRSNPGDNAIGMPDCGFLFPTFEGRRTNIYGALLYSKADDDTHEALTQALFGNTIPMAASEQFSSFHTVLADSLDEECSFEVAKNLHLQICDRIEEHKASHDPDPLVLTQNDIKTVLENVGIEEEKLDKFTKSYTDTFGPATDLPPKNIVSPKKFEVKTPDVVIKVAPDHTDLIETRIIGGVKYILIRADEGVELNGLNVNIIDE